MYLVENPYWWKVTIRYQLRAPDDTKVRGVQMHVEIDPRGADVAFPDAPTSLPEPVVTWGRLNDPPEALKRNSSARV